VGASSALPHPRVGLLSTLSHPRVDAGRHRGGLPRGAHGHRQAGAMGNVALYERSGFKVIGEALVPGGCPRVGAMPA
jgi:hypothetical protein